MAKKIIGFLLLIPAILITLAIVTGTPRAFTKVSKVLASGVDSYSIGFTLGTVIGYAVFVVVAFYLWKRAIKLTRGKKSVPNKIYEIGNDQPNKI